jgi:hypothetical protein
MLRLIVVLLFAFVGLQFPSYYWAYIQQTEMDARTLAGGSTPQYVIDELREQQRTMIMASPFEWPFVFANAFNPNRAEATLVELWEPQMPEQPVDWAYGGAGLVLGFFVTGILSGLFGGGRRPTRQPTPKRSTQPTSKPSSSASDSPWASAASAKPQQPRRQRGRTPIATGNLREASRMAQEALQQARQVVTSGSADPAVDDHKPSPMERRVPKAVLKASTIGAVIPSRHRPAAITRRFESSYAGPIERMTRDRG